MDFRFEGPFIIPGTRSSEEVWLEWKRVTEGTRARSLVALARGGERNEHGGWKEGKGLVEALEETKEVFSPRWNGEERSFLPLLERAAT